jgi:hypothetical protein
MKPADIYDEIGNRNKPVIVGRLRVFPPGGRSIISKSDNRDPLRLAEDTDIPVLRLSRIPHPPWLHPQRNLYFLMSLDRRGPWIFIGESDDSENLFPATFDITNLEIGPYILKGIVTGETEESIYIAEDSIPIEIVP